MSQDDSDVLSLLQPDLLTRSDLIEKIQGDSIDKIKTHTVIANKNQERCSRIQNLSLMTKERLVELFRQVLLPLPQRSYRTNRRGKMLTARRVKAGLCGNKRRGKEDLGEGENRRPSKVSSGDDRLRPPLHGSRDSRTGSRGSVNLDDIIINDRRKSRTDDRNKNERERTEEKRKSENFQSGKITLKRPSDISEKTETRSVSTENKKKRIAIRWP